MCPSWPSDHFKKGKPVKTAYKPVRTADKPVKTPETDKPVKTADLMLKTAEKPVKSCQIIIDIKLLLKVTQKEKKSSSVLCRNKCKRRGSIFIKTGQREKVR